MTEVVQIVKLGKSRPPGIVDNDIEPSEVLYSLLHQPNAIGCHTNVLPSVSV